MKVYSYIVRKFVENDLDLNGDILATVEAPMERSAWLGVLDLAKERRVTVRVFTETNEYRGIVYPDGNTESFLSGY